MLICEDIQAFNWAKAADYGGKISTLSCFLTAFLCFFLGQNAGEEQWGESRGLGEERNTRVRSAA